MIFVVAGGVYLAAHVPGPVSAGPAVGLLVVAGALLGVDVVALTGIALAWDRFFLVFRWALAAYVVIAGMLEYVFVLDHTPAEQLLLLSLLLAVFAVDVPMILAYSVAKHQPVGRAAEP